MGNSLNKVYSREELFSSVFDLWQNGLPQGNNIGLSSVDNLIRWELGRLSVITGVPNYGKSEFLDFICLRLNQRYGWKTLYFSPENYPVSQHFEKLASKALNKPFNKKCTSEDELHMVFDSIASNFFFMDYQAVSTIDDILSIATDYIVKEDMKVLVIDPFNRLEHQRPPSLTETEYISKLLDKLGNFGKQHNILIYLVAHPRKMNRSKDGIMEIPTYYDINGSANFANKADYCLAVHRDFAANETIIDVQKVKFKNLGCIGDCRLKYDIKSGNYIETDDDAPIPPDTKANNELTETYNNNMEAMRQALRNSHRIEIFNPYPNDRENAEKFDFCKDMINFDTEADINTTEFNTLFEAELKRSNVNYHKAVVTPNVLDKTVSLFNNVEDAKPKDVNLLAFLTTQRKDIDMAAIRTSPTYKEDKKKLPAITVSAQFPNKRSMSDSYTHSGLICIDIDQQKDENDMKGNTLDVLHQVPTLLKGMSNIAYLGHSLSGKGYTCIIPIAQPDRHREHFRALQEDFMKLGIRIDESCIDVSRLRIYCYDEYAYINPYAIPYTSIKEKEVKASQMKKTDINDPELQKVIANIEINHIDIAPSYREWFEVGCALYSEFGEDGRELFHRISKQHPKYDKDSTDDQFDKIVDNEYEAFSIGTVYHYYQMYFI